MDNRIKKIVILGGGTSGWMAASYLAKALQGTAAITVLEAPVIGRIGVGEATVPNLQRAFFDYIGVAEDDWMRECNASYKMAVKFVNWRTPGEGQSTPRTLAGRPDRFHHPFGLLPEVDQVPLSHYWNLRREQGLTDEPFGDACMREPAMIDALRGPRWLDGRRATRYAWHFDAQLVADYLCRFATGNLGVQHVQDVMTEALLDGRGYITGLRTQDHGVIDGDLFVDCSGFRGALINKAMGEPFIDMSDHLLCDSAVATQVPHDDERNGVDPCTSSIAMPAGWSWKIPLLTRFGTGYVYSSRFAGEDEATLALCRLWGLDPEDTEFTRIRFRVGRNRRAWVRNCVSVGLSCCFVEPLESTGIYFAYAALFWLARLMPDKNFDPVLIDRFNEEVVAMYDDTRDFLQAHFYCSPRTDTPFWKANKELTLADQIQEKMARYRSGLAINAPTTDESNYYGNFENEFRNFWTNGSYYCIFAGLGYLPERTLPVLGHKPESVKEADAVFASVRQTQRELVATLPSHYDLLRQIHGEGAVAKQVAR